MKSIQKYGILLGKFIAFLLGGSIIISVLYYFLVSSKVVSVLSFIYLILLFFIFGIMEGKKANAKGFLVGLKTGLLFIAILFFIHFFFANFKLMTLFYYLLLLFASILGSTIGINTKHD